MGTLGEQKPSQPAGSWVSAEALYVAHVSRGTLVSVLGFHSGHSPLAGFLVLPCVLP